MRTRRLSLHYKGSRFRNARLPVDVLSDLSAFRDLLVSYAKDEWRRRHADRKRVPKGFDKSLSSDFIKIEARQCYSEAGVEPIECTGKLAGLRGRNPRDR